MLWLIRDGNKKVPVFTGTFSALRSTNGYICQFSLQQQEAEPEPGSRAEPHSLNPTSLEIKNQHFHSGNRKMSEKDMMMLIQGISLSSSNSTSGTPMVSLLHWTWKFLANLLTNLSWPTFSTLPSHPWTSRNKDSSKMDKAWLKCVTLTQTLTQMCNRNSIFSSL